MAIAPSSGALSGANPPRNFPIGVRTAETITGWRERSVIQTETKKGRSNGTGDDRRCPKSNLAVGGGACWSTALIRAQTELVPVSESLMLDFRRRRAMGGSQARLNL